MGLRPASDTESNLTRYWLFTLDARVVCRAVYKVALARCKQTRTSLRRYKCNVERLVCRQAGRQVPTTLPTTTTTKLLKVNAKSAVKKRLFISARGFVYKFWTVWISWVRCTYIVIQVIYCAPLQFNEMRMMCLLDWIWTGAVLLLLTGLIAAREWDKYFCLVVVVVVF